MRTREEEYLRRMKALGYEPSLNGMDDEDIEWELSKMDESNRKREAEWRQPVYRPVDPGLKARILRMFGQPHDESAIPKGQEFYLNGWDNGEDEEEWPALKPEPRVPVPPGNRTMKPDLHGITYDPETGKITPNENGGFEIKGSKVPGQSQLWKNVTDIFSPSRGGEYRPLSYAAGGHDGGRDCMRVLAQMENISLSRNSRVNIKGRRHLIQSLRIIFNLCRNRLMKREHCHPTGCRDQ